MPNGAGERLRQIIKELRGISVVGETRYAMEKACFSALLTLRKRIVGRDAASTIASASAASFF
ncbi:hypothetical protein IVB04_18185 [Bradyrhizobium sp. 169]|nr:hypothetical protein [Bradyrhizobium sp. 169]